MPYFPPGGGSDATKLPLAGGTMTGTITSTLGTLTTTDKPFFSGTATWNDAAVTFNGIKLDVTSTASAGTSKFLDFLIAGTSKFSVSKGGSITMDGALTVNNSGAANHFISGSVIVGSLYSNGTIEDNISSAYRLRSAFGMEMRAGYPLNWSSGASYGTNDTGITRNAAGVLEINNGTAGTFRDLTLRTLTSTAGTITANTPAFTATQTWNNGAVVFKGITLDITNTASSGNSRAIEIRSGAATLFAVNISGNTFANLTDPDADAFIISGSYGGIRLGSATGIGWSDQTYYYGTRDIALNRNAAGVLEINNGTAGTFRDLKLRELLTAASTTTQAGLNLPHGAAPTSPVDGDVWSTTGGLFIRVNGVTKTVTLT